MTTDKIFDNSFEESDYDGRAISWKPDPSWSSSKDEESCLVDEMLLEEIDEIINNSDFSILNKPKEDGKLPNLSKNQIRDVYAYVETRIKDYNIIEVFAAISEYFDIQGQKFYNSLSNVHKDKLMLELDKRTNIIDKKGIKKLF
jgi:hypothetical protein